MISITGWLFNRSSRSAVRQNAASAVVPSGVKSNLPLRSVLPRTYDVFASNEEGIFRILKDEQRWLRLPTTETMPMNGYFVAQTNDAADIFYFTPRLQTAQNSSIVKKKAFGLYRTRDNGLSWQLLSQDYNFCHVFLHPEGVLYAIVETYFGTPKAQKSGGAQEPRNAQRLGIRQNILQSRDMGHTWHDITGPMAQQNFQLFGIFADPDNPGLICLNAWSTRGYIMQADNEDYNWQTIVDSAFRKNHETDESFFNRYYGTKSTLYMQQATLANYLQYSFGEEVDLPAFDIVPEQMAFTFPQEGEKTVSFSVQFLPNSPTVKIIDSENTSACWSLRFISPSGKRYDAGQSSARPAMTMQGMKSSNYQMINVNCNHPYARTIDLSQLSKFSETGTYRIQLLYDNTRIPGDHNGRWAGFFGSRIFEVTIV